MLCPSRKQSILELSPFLLSFVENVLIKVKLWRKHCGGASESLTLMSCATSEQQTFCCWESNKTFVAGTCAASGCISYNTTRHKSLVRTTVAHDMSLKSAEQSNDYVIGKKKSTESLSSQRSRLE